MIDFTSALSNLHQEIQQILSQVDRAQVETLLAEIDRARRIATYGVGREGLMMRGFAMRLYHLGSNVCVVGDMTAFPLRDGDLLLVSAGPGFFATVDALRRVALEAGARVFCFTAQPSGSVARESTGFLSVPAQTAADYEGKTQAKSVLPMGSMYELALFTLFELLVAELFERRGISAEAAFDRHTNLE